MSSKFREYERTSTTVANAYVKPLVDRYLHNIESALRERGFDKQLFVMQSSGGLVSPAMAREFPVRIIEPGPAAGILMSAIAGKAEGRSDVITFDMGGTTAKLGAIDGGSPAIMPSFEIGLIRFKKGSGLPINVPAVEMVEIGAGGGSIARVDTGMIAVGPESAGAEPGPICYGLGGSEPTVTDANVVLGYIAPDWFNAGALRLDAAAAKAGIESKECRSILPSVPRAEDRPRRKPPWRSVLSFRLSGAGGYGPPEKRDRQAIADDIADGYVTREAALRDYGWTPDQTV